MATVSNVNLNIDADASEPDAQAFFTVTYDVEWDLYDQASNQKYQELWTVIGADRGAGEDGVDDELFAVDPAAIQGVRSNGRATTTGRQIEIDPVDLVELNEDPLQNTDEIRVVVTLTPVAPSDSSAESNRVEMTVP